MINLCAKDSRNFIFYVLPFCYGYEYHVLFTFASWSLFVLLLIYKETNIDKRLIGVDITHSFHLIPIFIIDLIQMCEGEMLIISYMIFNACHFCLPDLVHLSCI